MSIRQFRSLLATSEYGSFAAAAKALNLTQSAVSMQVAALEQTLGAKLFDRSHRPPRLTPAGEIALARARAILTQYDDIFDALSTARPYRGTFSLGAIPTSLTNLLPAALMALRDKEPGLTVKVTSELSGEMERMIERRELDAAVMHKPPEIADGFAWQDIARQRVVIVAPPDSVEEEAAEIFAVYPYIRFNRAAWVAPLIEARFESLGIVPNTSAEIQSIEAIHVMVGLGFGVSVLPDVSPDSFIHSPLRTLDFGTPPIHRTVGLLSRADMSKKNARRVIGEVFCEVAGAGRSGVAPPIP
ncbi:MAG: LysR family transcriptional regulator [Kiloniellaceae bacterium]